MPKCSPIRKKKRNVCIGDMHDEVIIQSRNIAPPLTDDVNFGETFTGKATVWALVETKSGEVFFDGTNTETLNTHNVYIRFLSGVTAEDWVLFNDERLDILEVENLDSRNDFMLLKCTNRGTDANVANEL